MLLQKDKTVLASFDGACSFEWLETNGLGGWASSSVIGCNTRRYHGLLVAATRPPTERMVLVSKLDETIVTDANRFELGTNDYGDGIQPNGNQYLHLFNRKLFPEWKYIVNGIELKKTVAMVQNENTTLVIYEVIRAATAFTMELLPLIAGRNYHALQHAGNNIFWDVEFDQGIFHNQPNKNAPDIFISIPGATYHHDPKWYYRFNYSMEKSRGLDYEEDLFNHGIFSVSLKEGDSLGIMLSTDPLVGKEAHDLFLQEEKRKELLTDDPAETIPARLQLAADQFIVKRSVTNAGSSGEADLDLRTVIAGYHWFTDWGRDTMISLPGLCLTTDREDDARKIMAAFAASASMGMLPNRFPDNNQPPEYNNADGTLWFFNAVYKYLKATDDDDFVLQKILPVLKDIVDWHYRGTRYNIHVAEDGLLYAGEKGQQLTWMDVRIGDWVVTPRMGKPVEIQALWYNGLRIFSELLELNGQLEDADKMLAQAAKARESFNRQFWYKEGNYLFDHIDEQGRPDPTLRPNQLFAASLPFPLVENEKANAVLKIVTEKLYTPVGLRSLTPDDIHYAAVYDGDPMKRDASYHQGTVWTWLLGPYVDTIMKNEGSAAKAHANRIIHDFSYHLNEGCIGSISEIADAGGSHHPRGCIAQAWGVAEILRVIKEYGLNGLQ